MPGALPARVWPALATVYLVWGSTYLAIRYAVVSVPPLLAVGARFAVAGLLLAAVTTLVRGRGGWRMSGVQARTAVVSGVLLTLGGNGLVTIGEQRIPSGVAALIIACVPLWLVIMRAALGDRPGWPTVVGVGLGVVGVGALFLPGGGASGHTDTGYALVTVAASLSWAAGSLLAVRRPVPPDAMALASVQMLSGGVIALIWSVAAGELRGFHLGAVTPASWWALGYLLLVGSFLAYPVYLYLLRTAPVSLVSTYAFVNPVVAVLLGVAVAGEQLTAGEAVAATAIVVAVALVVTVEARRRGRVGPRWQDLPGGDPQRSLGPPDRPRRAGVR